MRKGGATLPSSFHLKGDIMLYLASPYSHPDPFVQEERYLKAAKVTAFLLKQNKWVYSPIVHNHELAKMAKLSQESSWWRAYNFAILARCDLLYVLRIEGTDESVGVKEEIAEAARLHIPMEYL